MTLGDMIRVINFLSDEQELPEIILEFINDAIARINIECGSVFPSLTLEEQDTAYPLPEKWIRSLIVPFSVGRVKQRDSSQFEYSDAYNEFLGNLDSFMAKYEIPEEFIDLDDAGAGGHPSSIYQEPPYPWWNF